MALRFKIELKKSFLTIQNEQNQALMTLSIPTTRDDNYVLFFFNLYEGSYTFGKDGARPK